MTPPFARVWSRDGVYVSLLVTVGAAVTVWFMISPVGWLQDDAYYYFVIARNIAGGMGSTFDGVNLTNGYQPLWLALLLPLLSISRSDVIVLDGVILVQGILLTLTLLLIYFSARLLLARPAGLIASLLWLTFTLQESFKGLEFSLHACLITSLGAIYLKWFRADAPRDTRPYLALGLVASLTVLARLDTIALTLILCVTLAIKGWHHANRLRRLIAFSVPVTLTVTVYAMVNMAVFGNALPVSGLVKLGWSGILLSRDPVYQSAGVLAAKIQNLLWVVDGFPDRLHTVYLTVGTLGAGGLGLASILTAPGSLLGTFLNRTVRPLVPFIVYSLWGWLVMGLVFHAPLTWTPWYYVIQPWVAAILIAGAFDVLVYLTVRAPILEQKKWLQRVTVGALYVIALVPLAVVTRQTILVGVRFSDGQTLLPLYEGARWAAAHLPPNAVLGAWNAGTVGFFSGHQTVDLDGVVNSFEFAERDRAALCQYWSRQGINYLVDVFEQDHALSVMATYPAYANCADRLEPVWSDSRYNAPWRVQVYHIRQPAR